MKDGLTMLYDPKDYYDVVKDAIADGYDAVKIDPIFAPVKDTGVNPFVTQGTHHRGSFRQCDLQCAVERIAAAREAGGPDMDIIVEVHSLLDANTAIELGNALEPYRIMYYEEPTMPCNTAVYKEMSEEAVAHLEDAGMIITYLDDAQLQAFKDAMAPAYDMCIETMGQERWDALQNYLTANAG